MKALERKIKEEREVIEQGQITVPSGLKEYTIRILDENDLEQIVQLQNSVLGKLKQKELCVPIPKEEMLEILTGNGESVAFLLETSCAQYVHCYFLLVMKTIWLGNLILAMKN